MYITKMWLEFLERLMFLCVGMQLATSIAAGWSLSTTVIMGAWSIGILVMIHQARSENLTQQQKVERADPPEEESVSEDDETRRVRKTPQKSATVSRLHETDHSFNPMVFRHTESNIFDIGLGYKFYSGNDGLMFMGGANLQGAKAMLGYEFLERPDEIQSSFCFNLKI